MRETYRIAALVAVLCWPLGLIAQVTGSGKANFVPRWTNSTNLGNSNMVVSGNSTCTGAHGGQPTKCVGVGTTNPTGNLHIVGGENTFVQVESSVANGNPSITVQANTPAGQAAVNINRADGGAPARLSFGTTGLSRWFTEIPGGTTEQLNISNASESPVVTFLQSGQVGIGTQTPSNLLTLLQGGGPALADGWNTYSSVRFKTEIHPLLGSLDRIQQLQGVSYVRKNDGKHEIGLIAEDVDRIVPEIVSRDPNTNEVEGLDYSRLSALLVEAVKAQQVEIDQLKAQVLQLSSHQR